MIRSCGRKRNKLEVIVVVVVFLFFPFFLSFSRVVLLGSFLCLKPGWAYFDGIITPFISCGFYFRSISAHQ